MDRTDDLSAVDALPTEIDHDDPEHPDVAVSYEEWSLGIFRGGRVAWENVDEGDEVRHLAGLSHDAVVRLARAVATGDFAAVEACPWLPGYPPPP